MDHPAPDRDVPVPVAPVHGVDVDRSHVLYDPVTGRAHVLNRSATRIWAMLDGATRIGDVAAALAAHTGASRPTVEADVRAAIDRFRAEGLLEPRASEVVAEQAWPVSEERSPSHDVGRKQVTLSLLDRTVRITTRSDAIADALTWWSEPLLTRESPSASYDADVVVDDTTVRTLPAHVNRLAARSSALVTLHAAGVVVGERAVVLPAEPDAGKSTLATALVEQGLGYLSDEVVGLALGGAGVVGYPKRISLEIGSWPLFPGLDCLAATAMHPSLDPTRVRWADARDVQPNALAWRGAPVDLGLVVVPRYAPDESPSLERLDPVDAMVALLTNSFNLASLGEQALRALRDVVLDVPCYRLVHADAHRAAALVRELVHELAVP